MTKIKFSPESIRFLKLYAREYLGDKEQKALKNAISNTKKIDDIIDILKEMVKHFSPSGWIYRQDLEIKRTAMNILAEAERIKSIIDCPPKQLDNDSS